MALAGLPGVGNHPPLPFLSFYELLPACHLTLRTAQSGVRPTQAHQIGSSIEGASSSSVAIVYEAVLLPLSLSPELLGQGTHRRPAGLCAVINWCRMRQAAGLQRCSRVILRGGQETSSHPDVTRLRHDTPQSTHPTARPPGLPNPFPLTRHRVLSNQCVPL